VLIVAQTMVLICAVCGLLMFIYIHVFSYRRLHRAERRMNRDDAREDRELANAQPQSQAVMLAMPAGASQEALFYLYHEQVRRFIDAKIDIMRNAAETQNRILLIQAEAMKNGAMEPGPLLLEARSGDGEYEVAVPARQGNVSMLSEQLRTARSETERHLSEIDQQIRSLPGPSLDQWVMAQARHTAD